MFDTKFDGPTNVIGNKNLHCARISVLSWNVGGVKTVDIEHHLLRQWLEVHEDKNVEDHGDVFVINFQEFRSLNEAINYLPSNFERHISKIQKTSRPSRLDAITEALENILSGFNRILSEKLVGLHSFVFVRKAVMKARRISDVRVARLAMGAFDRMGNKGAIIIRMTVDHKRLLFVNLHLTAGQGQEKFHSRIKQLSTILHNSIDDKIFKEVSLGALHMTKKLAALLIVEPSPSEQTHMTWKDKFDYIYLSGDFNFRTIPPEVMSNCEGPLEYLEGIDSLKHPISRRKSIFGKRFTASFHDYVPEGAWQHAASGFESNDLQSCRDGLVESPTDPCQLWLSDEFYVMRTLRPDVLNSDFVEAHHIKPSRISISPIMMEGSDYNNCPRKMKNVDRAPFPLPTYKFKPSKGTYDAKRTPAWTDRVLVGMGMNNRSDSGTPPVVSFMHCSKYAAVSNIIVSDHKPIVAKFNLFTVQEQY